MEEAKAVAEEAKLKNEAEVARLEVDVSRVGDWDGQGRSILFSLPRR